LNDDFLSSRVAGSLAAALIGDAMGSATEMLTPEEIRDRYGHVTRFHAPADATFAAGRRAGQLTDDGTLLLAMAAVMIESQGTPTPRQVARELLKWADDAELFRRFAGPSTRMAIEMLRAGARPEEAGAPRPMANDLRASNGSAMKVAPAGLAYPGDLERAVDAACVMCVPTHNSSVSYAGASAVATAAAAAVLPSASLETVVAAAVWGAERGEEVARRRAVMVPSTSVADRIRLAADIASGNGPAEERFARLARVIGVGLSVTEAVPSAIGAVVVGDGDPMRTIVGVVNLGYDSDTVATIAGAVAGALAGIERVPSDLVQEMLAANDLDLDRYVEPLCQLALANPGAATRSPDGSVG
jgi:ADP-ribosylglycohydrolase